MIKVNGQKLYYDIRAKKSVVFPFKIGDTVKVDRTEVAFSLAKIVDLKHPDYPNHKDIIMIDALDEDKRKNAPINVYHVQEVLSTPIKGIFKERE